MKKADESGEAAEQTRSSCLSQPSIWLQLALFWSINLRS
jgi:hypothetical protein